MYLERDDGLKFVFPAGTNFSDTKEIYTDVFTMPTMTAENNWAMQYDGEERNIQISLVLFDSDTDLSDGTNATAVKTVGEQYDYLMTFLSANHSYTLHLDSGISVSPINVDTFVVTQGEGQRHMEARIRFKMGENV